MRGSILSIDGPNGLISGDDGHRYEFEAAHWRGPGLLQPGTKVDFEGSGGRASDIHALTTSPINMAGTLNPMRKLWKLGGIGFIVVGVLLSLTIIGAVIGIPLIIIGILFMWLMPKLAGSMERASGEVVTRIRDGSR